MALRDSFGFAATARPGLEGASQQERSRPESPMWGKVRCPEVSDTATFEQAQKKLLSMKDTLRADGPASHADRRALWLLASGAVSKRAHSSVSYAEWAQKSAALRTEVVIMVDTDVRSVGLTFRPHPVYRSAAGINAMSNVLIALLASNPSLGYTRQLAHMVAFTMVVHGGAERQEDVFWTLKAFLEDKLFGYCAGEWLLGVKVEQEVLLRLAQRKFPRLLAHLTSLRLSVGSFTQPWLSGLFVSHLPPETVARVWDVMMCEGPKVLLRTGLALLKMFEQTLVSCSFPEVLRKVLDLRVGRTTDAALLLNTAFKGCGSLPGVHIEVLRQDALRVLRDAGEGIRRPTSPANINQSAGGGTSTQGSSGARSFFGVGSVSFKSRSSGAGSAGSSPPGGVSVLDVPSSPTPSDSGAAVLAPAAAMTRSASAAPTPAASQGRSAKQVGSQLSSMLSRLMGSVKESAVSHGVRRSATAGNVAELAAC